MRNDIGCVILCIHLPLSFFFERFGDQNTLWTLLFNFFISSLQYWSLVGTHILFVFIITLLKKNRMEEKKEDQKATSRTIHPFIFTPSPPSSSLKSERVNPDQLKKWKNARAFVIHNFLSVQECKYVYFY